ncbi:alpha/beta hydrolase [Paractinoplanes rishiriensis]|uniref:Alpha/beta hydrolase n=1 Tax=Paractinoplanes rishiriensis TaxID=1050105 RepID=A0A919K3G2_9ACTN|nr:alpha/beta hydrolase [Actinoplanes rishiriensis]GIF00066.1 alpha/beta hydrolase [Actinoplanes rishiriensis]
MLRRKVLALATVTLLGVTLVPATQAQAAGSADWGACPASPPDIDPRQQCAALSLPLDYRKPAGRKITVTISRIAATDPALRRGILLLNPGGPGGSGLDLPTYLSQSLPAEVLARYDLIGFDPRGVGASTPITCGLDPATPVDLILPYPAPDGSIDRNVAFARSTARACAQQAGDLLPYLTTPNTARDMDRIRAALGERKLSYLGYSYGSYLGAVYTSLFPARSDRIILDSGVDPKLIWTRIWEQFGPATALRFPDFAKWAAARNDEYGLGATPAAVTRTYFKTAETLDRDPIVTPDLTITGNFFRELTRGALYDDRNFPTLAADWQTLNAGAVTSLEVPFDNGAAALWAIACGDITWTNNISSYARRSAESRRHYPITAGMPPNIWPCAFWEYRPTEPPVAVTDKGPRNVLIMQNLRDPATGWASGRGLRRALGNRAAFISQDAGGHGVYGIRAGTCATEIGTAFLVNGTLPARDRLCAGPTPDDVTMLSAVPTFRTGPLGINLGG